MFESVIRCCMYLKVVNSNCFKHSCSFRDVKNWSRVAPSIISDCEVVVGSVASSSIKGKLVTTSEGCSPLSAVVLDRQATFGSCGGDVGAFLFLLVYHQSNDSFVR